LFLNHKSDTSDDADNDGETDNDEEPEGESPSNFRTIQLSDWIDDSIYTMISMFKIINCLNFTISNVTVFGEALLKKYSTPSGIIQPNFLHASDDSYVYLENLKIENMIINSNGGLMLFEMHSDIHFKDVKLLNI